MIGNKHDFYERMAATMRQFHGGKLVGWKRELSDMLSLMGKEHAIRSKEVSHKTLQARRETLYLVFRQLHEDELKLQSIFNLRDKHLQHLFSRWEQEGKSAATIQQRHTILNTFSKWIGKAGLVRPLENYLKDSKRGKRVYVAQKDKSWTPSGVSPEDLIDKVFAYDRRVGIQLKLIHAFGMRKKEAVMFRPWKTEEAGGVAIQIYHGTKGGRHRVIPISNDYQRAVLEEAKQLAPNQSAHIGDPEKTLEQNMRRMQYVLEKFGITKAIAGVTAHGLRHEYANTRYRLLTGEASPLQGGKGEMYRSKQGKFLRKILAEELGHSRISVTSAYYGSDRTKKADSTS